MLRPSQAAHTPRPPSRCPRPWEEARPSPCSFAFGHSHLSGDGPSICLRMSPDKLTLLIEGAQFLPPGNTWT